MRSSRGGKEEREGIEDGFAWHNSAPKIIRDCSGSWRMLLRPRLTDPLGID